MSEKFETIGGPEKKEKLRVRIKLKWGELVVEKKSPGVFAVVEENLISEEDRNNPERNPDIAFSSWDNEVENLDTQSDVYQIWRDSEHLRWKDVELSPWEFRAPSIRKLKQALEHVEMRAYDAWEDI